MILDVMREKQKIDHVFDLAKQIPSDEELLSIWAKYLCVQTSGFIETSLRSILIQYTKRRSSPEVFNYVESMMSKITNLNEEKITSLLSSFSSEWGTSFREKRSEEQKAAIDSVVANRHHIVHGRSVGITIARMKSYYSEVVKLIAIIDEECVNKNN